MKRFIPTLLVCFQVITPESAEHGDFADSGVYDEYDYSDSPLELAKHILDQGCVEPSSSDFHSGIWYTQTSPDVCFKTGGEEYLTFHLDNFPELTQRLVHHFIINGLPKTKVG